MWLQMKEIPVSFVQLDGFAEFAEERNYKDI